ncbi:UDP-N-acetylmuramoyl-L-alanyl-D-glutamate--2,6-diaminopimelate ligase [Urechidicola vernalis]|uniref:UDP-N-acetylmuramoyl-L-alanyl-D-glutamate--2,6-diaminopimelate ligase n=1 Tax=Urechidicola vernalis TaxID=3075600 RepID=A0ABU2Y516_9FLAO|nr:UDP-N-acetylmuramoyl-L-alanyl-D-glutamate--2,6-diaminopimelate ligase [Urechidicola sp. P050]MDT0552911.1 UDP-N-acetylmuramoyl-L-alanyl-D-glutamate--2,6-diaminopimelate ligase [Urechidicola sp. P050]
MQKLKDILYGVAVNKVNGSVDTEVFSVEFDSKKVQQGSLFVAQKGVQVDGHKFIGKTIELGAAVVVCEHLPENLINDVVYVEVNDSNSALAIIASNFYENPSRKLKLIGITGTNGKTTIATLSYNLFRKAGYKVGLLSTVKVMVDETEYVATHTTPDSVSINRYLQLMVQSGVDYCFMEVSSHGIHQKRTEGLEFAGGVFTNLSHDHLDYHNSFSEYRDVKKVFFDQLPKGAFALVNADDKNGNFMLQNTRAKKLTYGLKTMADYKVRILENQFSGLLLNMNGTEIWVKLIGSFNASNLLAIYATSDLLGLDGFEVLQIMSQLDSVDGRFQQFMSNGGVTAIVDYAHTPDALKNVLNTINDIRTGNENVITVVGCGGDRDKTKRPKMGHIASHLSSQVIFTSDNPRTENPQGIIEDIEKGVEPQNYRKTLSILDREQAIKTGCKLAKKGDILLVAGKGHETYQEVNGVRSEFDDYKKVRTILKELQK